MRILLVDDHAIVRAGLRRLLAAIPGSDVLEASTGPEALALLQEKRPDLVILDLNLPSIGGLELLRRLSQRDRATRVLVLSMHAEPLYAARALEAGARGYMSKNAAPDEILKAVRQVGGGGRYIEAEIAQELALQTAVSGPPLPQLTERDMEILRLLAEGRNLQEIADAIGISYKTIANTCSQIKAKLGVTRTADLVRLSIELGIS
jgi:two-component system, NarL family, invasion response regulator UvrY